jgi:hypothetical protein
VTAVVLAVLALATALSALGYALSRSSAPPSSVGTVTVSADANLSGAPDTLTANFAVTDTAGTAAGALDENNSQMAQLQGVFISARVPKSALQTSDLSVSPTYNSYGTLTGYRTEDDLTVTLHDFTKAAKAIDAAENAVGNNVQINGISFSLSNNSKLLGRARVLAMQEAYAEAKSFAAGAGEKVGAAISISNQQQVTTPVPFGYAGLYKAAFNADEAVPIRAGTLKIGVHVNVTYRLLG